MKYQLSRALTKSERASLEAAHADLGKALADVAQASKSARANEKKLKQLEARETALEKEANRGNEDASRELVGVKDQVPRVRAAITGAGAAEGRVLNREVLHCSELLPGIIVRDLQAQVEDLIEERNEDFFFDRARARGVAFGCDALPALHGLSRLPPKPHSTGEFPKASGFTMSSINF